MVKLLSNKLKKDMLKILKDLIRFNSENPPGKTEEIIQYLVSNVFKETIGFRNNIYEYQKENVKLHNLVSKIGKGNKEILFCGHFDTVPIGHEAEWNMSPLGAELNNGNVYGRGSADMKGGVTSIIGVIKTLIENEKILDKFNLVFIGTADEEAGMSGSQFISKEISTNNTELLIIPEPTNLDIGIAEKGVIWCRLIIKGKAAHGAVPYKGLNAIECAARIIPKLKLCLQDRTNSILGRSTLNIGKIEGGSAINVVPERVELDLDYRIIPEQNPLKLVKNLNSLKFKPCIAEIKIPVQLPALKTDKNNQFIENLKSITNKKVIGLPYATDAAYLVNSKDPFPFVLFGPGDPEKIHKVNEYVPLEQVYNCSEYLLSAIIKSFIKK